MIEVAEQLSVAYLSISDNQVGSDGALLLHEVCVCVYVYMCISLSLSLNICDYKITCAKQLVAGFDEVLESRMTTHFDL